MKSVELTPRAFVFAIALSLSGCGGGGSSPAPTPTPTPAPTPTVTAASAARFLTQASFGPTDASIATVQSSGISGYLASQVGMTPSASHQTFVEGRLTALQAANANAKLTPTEFYESFWNQAAVGPDQLRQRVKLALSEIFVVSLRDPAVDVRGAASYYDTLGADSFTNFRSLLQDVTLHPMMGVYLTYVSNVKENPATGQHPDQNYAREVQQLMTIGLYQLNLDGTQKLDSGGNPIPTFTASDVDALSRVFTGFGWYSPSPTATTFQGGAKDANATVTPMIAYANYHSTSAKTFLGVTIPASTTPDPAGDLKIALDTLFNHPNVGPFIGKQLIQRLVTSNPSPAYVARVATVFNDNGHGVRGDMAAVVTAILTDPEARDDTVVTSPTFGKLREPVARLAEWMRSFGATSASGNWLVGSTSANTSLSESALAAPSVFNFWLPGYIPPHTKLATMSLTAPEFQVADEVSTVGYLNTMQGAIGSGIGSAADVQAPYAAEMSVAGHAGALTDRVNLLLLYGSMSSGLRGHIVAALSAITVPAASAATI
jgi:uncharacterized protein (DUF1800 family)